MQYVFSIHEHELKPDVDTILYEQEVTEAIKNLKVKGLLAAHLLKGFKGSRKDKYTILWIWESEKVIEENFGTLDNPRWPEDWLYYENEILAKYLTCHPDKINFTCHNCISKVSFSHND